MKTSLKSFSALLGIFFALILGFGSASALPPGGAATVDSAGTASSVSPTTLKAGDTISFKLTGFPANEQVYVKVDDGDACPSDSAQGACVVHQQKSDSNGTVEGSFILSKDLAEGTHTLRFLATEIKYDSNGKQIGTLGYSNRSPEFTISGVNENSSGGTTVNVDPAIINQAEDAAANNANGSSDSNSSSSDNNSGSNNSDSKNDKSDSNSNQGSSGSSAQGDSAAKTDGSEEETVYQDANGNVISKEEYDRLMADAKETAKPTTSTKASATASSSAGASAAASASASSTADNTAVKATANNSEEGSGFPWVGTIVLVLALLVAGLVIMQRRKSS